MRRHAYWPREVVWHDHIFPSSKPWDSDDETGRLDVVEFDNGDVAVTDPFSDPPHITVANALSRADGIRLAERLVEERK